MNASNMPLSEQFRLVAKKWVEADRAASLMEETKTTRLSQHMQNLIREEGEMPNATAERLVKASPQWQEDLIQMVNLRTQANRLKVQLEYIRMQFSEHQSFEATKRAEMKL